MLTCNELTLMDCLLSLCNGSQTSPRDTYSRIVVCAVSFLACDRLTNLQTWCNFTWFCSHHYIIISVTGNICSQWLPLLWSCKIFHSFAHDYPSGQIRCVSHIFNVNFWMYIPHGHPSMLGLSIVNLSWGLTATDCDEKKSMLKLLLVSFVVITKYMN